MPVAIIVFLILKCSSNVDISKRRLENLKGWIRLAQNDKAVDLRPLSISRVNITRWVFLFLT
jgi:hypothetical protein